MQNIFFIFVVKDSLHTILHTILKLVLLFAIDLILIFIVAYFVDLYKSNKVMIENNLMKIIFFSDWIP